MKPLTIAIGPSGLFWFNIECSANFYRKSYWSDPFSVLWLKWLFKTRNSKPLICWHWWCSRSWKTQKTCSALTSGSRLLLHLSFSFSSLLLLLHLLGCLRIFVFVWSFLFWLLLSLKGQQNQDCGNVTPEWCDKHGLEWRDNLGKISFSWNLKE